MHCEAPGPIPDPIRAQWIVCLDCFPEFKSGFSLLVSKSKQISTKSGAICVVIKDITAAPA